MDSVATASGQSHPQKTHKLAKRVALVATAATAAVAVAAAVRSGRMPTIPSDLFTADGAKRVFKYDTLSAAARGISGDEGNAGARARALAKHAKTTAGAAATQASRVLRDLVDGTHSGQPRETSRPDPYVGPLRLNDLEGTRGHFPHVPKGKLIIEHTTASLPFYVGQSLSDATPENPIPVWSLFDRLDDNATPPRPLPRAATFEEPIPTSALFTHLRDRGMRRAAGLDF
jgi:hypothetical protein